MAPSKRIALFPGSFDPFTIGHQALAERASLLFDHIVVAIGQNSDKHYMLSIDQRVAQARQMTAHIANVSVCSYSDMTIDCCHRQGATFILRGLRNDDDLAYEKRVAAVNHQIDPSIETVFLLATPDMEGISSTLERERLLHQSPAADTSTTTDRTL